MEAQSVPKDIAKYIKEEFEYKGFDVVLLGIDGD